MNPRFRIVPTQEGHVGLAATKRGLRRVFLPQRDPSAVRKAILHEFPEASEDDSLLPELADDLKRYFEGEPVEFNVRFDWSGWGSFEVDVWRACARISYSQTASYGALAEQLGRPGAARAVGMAMSHNPFPIVVPCHRVLMSDGSLGGYSGPGGVEFKRHLLEMEAAAHAATS